LVKSPIDRGKKFRQSKSGEFHKRYLKTSFEIYDLVAVQKSSSAQGVLKKGKKNEKWSYEQVQYFNSDTSSVLFGWSGRWRKADRRPSFAIFLLFFSIRIFFLLLFFDWLISLGTTMGGIEAGTSIGWSMTFLSYCTVCSCAFLPTDNSNICRRRHRPAFHP